LPYRGGELADGEATSDDRGSLGLAGNCVKVVEKHYATWSGVRQRAVEETLAAGWQRVPKLPSVKQALPLLPSSRLKNR